MPEPLQTVAELLDRIRADIDEPLDPSSNFWTNAELLTYLNEGMREVWQTVREADQNYFLRTLRSDAIQGTRLSRDPATMPLTLYGRTYDPRNLRLRAGAEFLILPPDFRELVTFEPLADMQGTDSGVTFHPLRQTHSDFRAFSRLESTATQGGTYYYDLEWTEGLPLMRIVPRMGETCHTLLRYIHAPLAFTRPESDTLEGTGFQPEMVDALVAYVVWTALTRKPGQGNAQAITVAQTTWQTKLALCARAAGPRQAQEPTFVEGMLEDELDWSI